MKNVIAMQAFVQTNISTMLARMLPIVVCSSAKKSTAVDGTARE